MDKTHLKLGANTNAGNNNEMSITIDRVRIVAGKSIRYLGVLFNLRVNFTDHTKASAEKISGAVQKIGKTTKHVKKKAAG